MTKSLKIYKHSYAHLKTVLIEELIVFRSSRNLFLLLLILSVVDLKAQISTSKIIVESRMGTEIIDEVNIVGEGGESVGLNVNSRIRSGDALNSGGIWLANTAPLLIGQYNTNRIGFYNAGWHMQLNPSGFLGLGPEEPTHPLFVTQSFAGWQSVFKNGSSNVFLAHGDGYGIFVNTGNNNDATRYGLHIRNSEKVHLHLNDQGFLGLGNSEPIVPLFLTTENSGWQARFKNGVSDIHFAHSGGYGMHINTGMSNSASRYALHIRNSQQIHLHVRDDGYVGIGTDSPTEKLHVNGKIRTAQNTWADFVFEADYDLTELYEVEEQILQKGHLPGIPSAEEVKKDGYVLGDMDAKLLQKIEELTLYLIEQNKQNQNQQRRIDALERELRAIKAQ